MAMGGPWYMCNVKRCVYICGVRAVRVHMGFITRTVTVTMAHAHSNSNSKCAHGSEWLRLPATRYNYTIATVHIYTLTDTRTSRAHYFAPHKTSRNTSTKARASKATRHALVLAAHIVARRSSLALARG
jgi:hypothetical protein